MSRRSRALDRLQSLIHHQKQWVRSRLEKAARKAAFRGDRGFALEPFEPRVLLSGNPTVLAFDVNSDEIHRSIVDSVAVQFSEDISTSLETSDVLIRNVDTHQTIDPSDINVVLDASGDRATFTFPGLTGQTLPNGNYEVALSGSGIQDGDGNLLDGNGDGAGGDDYEFNLYRYFGDTQGDRDVDNAELFQFSRTFLEVAGNTNFNRLFDFNADGDVDNGDLFQFSRTFIAPLSVDVTINASLNNDTAPLGATNVDSITTDPTVSGRIAFLDQADRVRVGLDGMAVADFVTLSESDLGANGGFLFDQAKLDSLFGALTEGGHTLNLRAEDASGNPLAVSSLSIELDTTSPQVNHVSVSPSIQIGFDEPLDESLISLSGVTLSSFGSDGVSGIDSNTEAYVAEVSPINGSLIREVDLRPQSRFISGILGLAFHSDGDLLASSSDYVVYKVAI